MGSLMGWSTKPTGAEDALKRCNSSMTKDEVDRFWRVKRSAIAQHLEEANKDAALSPRGKFASAMPSPQSPGLSSTPENGAGDETTKMSTTLPQAIPRPAWWTRSSWAFLNDPPTRGEKESKYTPQFDVATKGHMALDHSNSGNFNSY